MGLAWPWPLVGKGMFQAEEELAGRPEGLPGRVAVRTLKCSCQGEGDGGAQRALAPYNLPSLSAFQEPHLRHDPVLSE